MVALFIFRCFCHPNDIINLWLFDVEKKLNSENVFIMKKEETVMTNKQFIEGNAFNFGGCKWIVAEVKGNCAVLQSCGVTAGPWPGYKMPQFGNREWYDKDIDGLDISEYDDKTATLYNSIKAAEYQNSSYGKGLYLVPWNMTSLSKGNYEYTTALTEATENCSLLGASGPFAWFGTCNINSYAYYVDLCGSIGNNGNQSSSFVIAPAFNLDVSKVRINGDEIVIL